MTTPRRRVLRTPASAPVVDPRQIARSQRQRAELIKSRSALRRWLTRLKRATNSVFDLHQRIARLESVIDTASTAD